MADQRLRTEWRQTASLIAATLEPHRDRKTRSDPFSADDFDPFAKERRQEAVPGTIECLRVLVPDEHGKAPGLRRR